MSVTKEDDKSQLFTTSMFGSKEDLCKAKLEWDIKKAAVLAERERCAVVAWKHYMHTCKKMGLSPANYEEWLCAEEIRSGNP